MARLTQLHPNDYRSQQKIEDDFQQLYAFLQQTEIGGRTLPELLLAIFSLSGTIKSDFLQLRWENNAIEYRIGGATWQPLGVGQTELQGPAGVSGAGTGDMVKATYDPDNDGKIDRAQLDLADGSIEQEKVANLQADLLNRARVYVQETPPVAPSYPPSGPFTIWVDTSVSPQAVRWYDGVGNFRSFGGADTASSGARPLELIAGENISSRDIVFVSTSDRYGANLATGGTPSASAGTAANAFDADDATVCSTASLTGNVAYQFTAAQEIGLVELLFPAGAQNLAFVIETSNDGATWTNVFTQAVDNFDGAGPSFFRIANPVSATRIRVRQTAGTSQMAIRTFRTYKRELEAGRVYRTDSDANNPRRAGTVLGVALQAIAAGARGQVQTWPGLIDGFTGLTAGQLCYTSVNPGAIMHSAGGFAHLIGEARSASVLNFDPPDDNRRLGSIELWAGTIADLPHGYVLCDGSHLDRTTFTELFARVNTVHGSGDGKTSFKLPDLRDKFIVGARQDNSGKPNTNLTGALTQTGGSRTASVAAGGGGANLSGATGPLQVTLDPPYYALAFIMRAY